MQAGEIRKRAVKIRKIRRIHRIAGIYFFIFILIITLTGLLLAWKKNSAELISVSTKKGTATQLEEWMPLADLTKIAIDHYKAEFSAKDVHQPDRMDVRPSSGTIKFLFSNNYYEIQLDATTGDLLHSGYRVSDIIENIHDGSIIDKFLGTKHQIVKLIYSTLLGLATLTFAITGFWVWNERNKIRQAKTREI
jgi:uncharacterized iron-regulated membrane protein